MSDERRTSEAKHCGDLKCLSCNEEAEKAEARPAVASPRYPDKNLSEDDAQVFHGEEGRRATTHRLCKLVYDVHEKLHGWENPCDCICPEKSKDPSTWRSDGRALEWIESVVRGALAKYCPPDPCRTDEERIKTWLVDHGADESQESVDALLDLVDDVRADEESKWAEIVKAARTPEARSKSEKCGNLCQECETLGEDAAPSECICHWCLIRHMSHSGQVLRHAIVAIKAQTKEAAVRDLAAKALDDATSPPAARTTSAPIPHDLVVDQTVEACAALLDEKAHAHRSAAARYAEVMRTADSMSEDALAATIEMCAAYLRKARTENKLRPEQASRGGEKP